MATLADLSPARQTQYDALLPQIELAARQASQARGMFYSGQATDAETKAKADLLAKLAEQDAQDQQATKQQQAAINQAQSAQENQSKAASRAANLGLIGSGVGAAATIGGLMAMNKGGGIKNMFQSGGNTYTLDANGKATLVNLPGQPGVGGAALAAPAAAPMSSADGGGLAGLSGTGPTPMMSTQPGGLPQAGFASAAPAAAAVAPAAPVASMWNDPLQAAGGVGMGLAGGVGGYLAANQVNAGGKNTALASGLGGLAGGATGALMSSGNPYAAGAGALLGSFGGGLLGNLFK